MIIRLDKLLAHSGYGSRKEVKKLIRDGYVYINDIIVTDDDYKVDTDKDNIHLFGDDLEYDEYIYILLNKPQNYISSTVGDYYPPVTELVKEYQTRNLFPVGRLDVDTTGLLILTNDGKFAHSLTSPNREVEKEYYLTYEGKLDEKACQKFENGINIDNEYITKPAKLVILNDHEALVTIKEGKFHQVKKMISHVGAEVSSLKRIRMDKLVLNEEELKVGEYRHLTSEEIEILKK